MGWFSPKNIYRKAKKVAKKIAVEVEDTVTGKNKYTRDPSRIASPRTASTAAPREQSEELEATVEKESSKLTRRKKGKRALLIKKGEVVLTGKEGSGLNIPVNK